MIVPQALVAHDYVLMQETPHLYAQSTVSAFIEQEVRRPSKQWIASIIAGEQEREQVVLRTDEFVLLPDTERVNRYWRAPPVPGKPGASHQHHHHHARPPLRMTLNWLAIVHDMRVRTMRDLRGEHLPMLRRLLSSSLQAVETHTGIPAAQVMAYVHYPPSVYQLHVHFSFPYGQYCHRDTYRMHSVETIINNLEIDPDYYAKATLHLAMNRQSPHCAALLAQPAAPEEKKEP
jgi:m7GpppX diphosphatase